MPFLFVEECYIYEVCVCANMLRFVMVWFGDGCRMKLNEERKRSVKIDEKVKSLLQIVKK